MMRVLLTASDFNIGYELTPVNKRTAKQYKSETGDESRLFQSDWDFPALAQNLGWNMARTAKCSHRGTDGSVKCPDCGKTPSYFIGKAQGWLDKRTDTVIQRAGIEMYFYND